ESLLGAVAGLILWAKSMPSRPNRARTNTIKKRERKLERRPAMFRKPRAGTWRDPATQSDAVYHAKAPVYLDANRGWGLHRSDGFWGGAECALPGSCEIPRFTRVSE